MDHWSVVSDSLRNLGKDVAHVAMQKAPGATGKTPLKGSHKRVTWEASSANCSAIHHTFLSSVDRIQHVNILMIWNREVEHLALNKWGWEQTHKNNSWEPKAAFRATGQSIFPPPPPPNWIFCTGNQRQASQRILLPQNCTQSNIWGEFLVHTWISRGSMLIRWWEQIWCWKVSVIWGWMVYAVLLFGACLHLRCMLPPFLHLE